MSDAANRKIDGTVFSIQKMSIHDGPGIRSTVFLKGCPLTCLWCSNPESQKREEEIACFENRCVQCGYCAEVCPKQIIEHGGSYSILKRQDCDMCMQCVEECCTNAKKAIGQRYAVEELYQEILKDKPFYDSSGGGVTFSGGEPLMQADFLIEMLKICKENGIHTAIETTGMADILKFMEVLKYVDLIYFDLKHMDRDTHIKLTGVPNDKILENLALISKKHDNIVVRIPVIPGLNDSAENIRETAAYAASLSIPCMELLPYHDFGESKYGQLGRKYTLPQIEKPSEEDMEALAEEARNAIGIKTTQVCIMQSM